jgi:uncharacterized membrane protein
MTPPTQAQLDDFARRLRALEGELAQMREQTTLETWAEQQFVEEVPEAQARPRVTSLHLTRALGCLNVGDVRAALKLLERVRRAALDAGDIEQLQEALQVAQIALERATGFRRGSAKRLVYAIQQNIGFLERKRAIAAGEEPRAVPPSAIPHERVSTPAPAQPRPSFGMTELSEWLGARALALSGGFVTLLGIVFFFVLAVNRGWIGPSGRIALGAAASAAVFFAGIELRRRYGETHSALAAVGAGIAGGYATLLAAAAMYDMVPDYAALVIAASIAAVGTVTALRWRSEIIAGLGLIGATLAPLTLAAQDGLSALGTTFAAFMLAATAIVALRERWSRLLVAGMVAGAPQILALVYRAEYHAQHPVRIVLLAAVFSGIYLAIGIAYELRSDRARLGQMTTGPITGAALLAAGSAARLYDTPTQKGTALLVIALVYGVLAAVLFRRRNLSALLAAIAFTIGAIALSVLLSGQPLAYAWAAEAAALAWLARRAKEIRFQLWSAAYLLLALAHVLIFDAPPTLLFASGRHPVHGIAPAAAVAVVAAIFATYCRPWTETFEGLFAPQLRAFAAAQQGLRYGSLWLGGVFGTYALSLAVLSLFSSFDWGHVALAAVWSALGLAVLLAGTLRRWTQLRIGGWIWIGATTAIVSIHGAVALAATPRSTSYLVVAAALLGAALAYQLLGRQRRLAEIAAVATVLSIGFAWEALATLLHGKWLGAVLLLTAALYGVLAAAVFPRREQRDFTTELWAIAVVAAAAASAILVSGTYLVLAWSAAGVGFAWLAARTREERLLLAAGSYLAAAFVHAIVFEAQPNNFFQAQADPASGVPAVLIVAVAIALSVRSVRAQARYADDVRRAAWWTSGVLAVYAISLSLLELLQHAFPHASMQTDFQRGHTAVSAFWGLLGLALLYIGLTRWRSLRIAGFALFAVSLAKIFLYDLPSLSSITRALSFLAVGAVLLLGGFFYQRLASTVES